MAGHSKWANIKHRKGAMDAKKALAYAKLSKEISVAARLGGKDPNFNFRLRNAIERARSIGLPADNIQRAIDKLQNQKDFTEIIYEGYGPGGSAILIQAATNNRNRTASELRLFFGKAGGNLGETGCVSWNFKQIGLIQIPNMQLSEDAILNLFSETTLQNSDFELVDDELLVSTNPADFEASLLELQKQFTCHGELTYSADNLVDLTDSTLIAAFKELIQALEENEDVQGVFHNARLKDLD